jgi:hypothetical protein
LSAICLSSIFFVARMPPLQVSSTRALQSSMRPIQQSWTDTQLFIGCHAHCQCTDHVLVNSSSTYQTASSQIRRNPNPHNLASALRAGNAFVSTQPRHLTEQQHF